MVISFLFFFIRQSVIVFQETGKNKKREGETDRNREREKERERERKKKIDTFPELSLENRE